MTPYACVACKRITDREFVLVTEGVHALISALMQLGMSWQEACGVADWAYPEEEGMHARASLALPMCRRCGAKHDDITVYTHAELIRHKQAKTLHLHADSSSQP